MRFVEERFVKEVMRRWLVAVTSASRMADTWDLDDVAVEASGCFEEFDNFFVEPFVRPVRRGGGCLRVVTGGFPQGGIVAERRRFFESAIDLSGLRGDTAREKDGI